MMKQGMTTYVVRDQLGTHFYETNTISNAEMFARAHSNNVHRMSVVERKVYKLTSTVLLFRPKLAEMAQKLV